MRWKFTGVKEEGGGEEEKRGRKGVSVLLIEMREWAGFKLLGLGVDWIWCWVIWIGFGIGFCY